MSKITIKPTKIITPDGKTLTSYNKNVFVESDKITVLPTAGETGTVLMANGYQFFLDADVADIGTALGTENMSAYT